MNVIRLAIHKIAPSNNQSYEDVPVKQDLTVYQKMKWWVGDVTGLQYLFGNEASRQRAKRQIVFMDQFTLSVMDYDKAHDILQPEFLCSDGTFRRTTFPPMPCCHYWQNPQGRLIITTEFCSSGVSDDLIYDIAVACSDRHFRFVTAKGIHNEAGWMFIIAVNPQDLEPFEEAYRSDEISSQPT